MTPHRQGPRVRPAAVALREGYHSPQVEVATRLNTNEAPEPPPQAFLDELAATIGDLAANRYPDRRASALRGAVAAFHGVEPDQVFCANGSNEVLQCLFLAYGGHGRVALVFEPTYALHSHIARLTGTEVVSGWRDAHFLVDMQAAREQLGEIAARTGDSSPSLTMLCSPNNPTGEAEPAEVVESLAAEVPGLLVVDEAYGQFARQSALGLVHGSSNVVVVRTFSKTWAMAALRLGYLVAHPDVVAACEQVALPYHLDAVKQAAGTLALRYEPEMRARVARLVEQRQVVEAALGALGVETWPSQANFVLFRTREDASEIWRRLVEHSVLVRDVSGFPGLERCLRVTIGTPEENERFLGALASVLAACGSGRDRAVPSV